MTNFKKEFIKCLETVDYSLNRIDVFSDFLELMSITLALPINGTPELIKEFKSVQSKYNEEQFLKLDNLSKILVDALENNMGQDFLGTVYMDIGAGNVKQGQFFTPYHISYLKAALTLNPKTIIENVKQGKYETLSDPCCGAGTAFLATAQLLRENDINPTRALFIHGCDIDKKCFQMTYIQVSLCGLAGVINWGDALKNEMYRSYMTPVLKIDEFWKMRLFVADLLYLLNKPPESPSCQEQKVIPISAGKKTKGAKNDN